MTLQEEWRKYRDACYPDGMPAEQNRECHQAFFAGAFVALTRMVAAADQLTEDQAKVAVADLYREAEEICRAHIQAREGA